MRQHCLGPYPIDPNLISQGIPPDDRVDFNDRIYAPVEGTPMPPGVGPAGTPPDAPPPGAPVPLGPPPGPVPGAVPAQAVPPPPPPGNSLNGVPIPAEAPPAEAPPADGAVPAAPSAFNGNASGGPSVAVAHYDPNTGEYMSPDGSLQRVQNLAAGGAPKSWKDLLPI